MKHDTLPSNASIDLAMRVDRFELRKLRKRIVDARRSGRSPEQDETGLLRRLAESIELTQRRIQSIPTLAYPDELPITAHRDAIVSLIQSHQVIVVCGETGSGKSTQLPKFCLDAGLGRSGLIGHTQPRRIAARSIAQRLAEELQVRLGDTVGCKIRFSDNTRPETLVKLMTDGILLAETGSDRFLDQYDAILIDEAHERSLNIDFLLGYLRKLQGKRPDLRIIITSATIDAERFAEHFSDEHGPAPILNVEGRGHPVTIRYLPFEDILATDQAEVPYDTAQHVIAAIDEILTDGTGDVLVFLPTERDIREVSHRVSGHFHRRGGNMQLLPLYARLPQKEQQQIFNPQGGARRIVFATNVAESSLTVPRIRYVIDGGTARISRYSPRSKVQRLPIESISQASADQRSGRCGRLGPGVCIRLYSQQDYESRSPFTTPEIRRTNLASVVLQTKMLQLGPIDEFPFLDPPRPEAVREGIRTLREIGAMDQRDRLTPVGRQLGRMPVDPRVGRILLAAVDNGVLPEVLPIAAALEIHDPRDRPPQKQQAADEAHQIFRDAQSDFLSYLRIWQFYHRQRENLSRNRLARACRQRFLSPTRMREWTDVYRQLRDLTKQISMGKKKPSIGAPRLNQDAIDSDQPIVDEDQYALIHQSLLTGLLSGIAQRGDEKEYSGVGGLSLFLWPGSVLIEAKPKWVVAAELVETSKRYARTIGRIDPEWLESIAQHLIKCSYSDTHWSSKVQGAFCYERVNLFGLPIVARRRIPLAPIDPQAARELLIQQGLVEEQLRTTARCVTHNRKLLQRIAELAAKTRRRDLIVDPHVIEHFYHQRLPDEVTDRVQLERWDREHSPPAWVSRLRTIDDLASWIAEEPTKKEVLDEGGDSSPFMRPEDLLLEIADTIEVNAFPDSLDVHNTQLPLQYHFEPGSDRDGVTVTVPQVALDQVSDDRLGWLVPGMLESKLVAMIKALPKRIRRNLVPAADVARDVLAELMPRYGEIPFVPAVCAALSRHAEMSIQASDFSTDKLPFHAQALIQVVDDQGHVVATGRGISDVRGQLDLDSSQDAPSDEATDGIDPDDELCQDGWTSFEIDVLPESVTRHRGGVQVSQYPGLVDRGDSVGVRLFASEPVAEKATRAGLARLYAICEKKELRSQVRWLPESQQSKLLLSNVLPSEQFETAMSDLIARCAFVEDRPVIRSRDAFEAARTDRGSKIAKATQDIAKWLTAWAKSYQDARQSWESLHGNPLAAILQDVQQQVQDLTGEGFLISVPWKWLRYYPRYFAGIAYRLDKVRGGGQQRDLASLNVVTDLISQVAACERAFDEASPQACRGALIEIEEARWLIQELRISLFAQPLGTAMKVSPQRIEKKLAKLV